MKRVLLGLGVSLPTLSTLIGKVFPQISGGWLYVSIVVGACFCAYSVLTCKGSWLQRSIRLIVALGAMLLLLAAAGIFMIRESGLIGTQ